MVFLILSSGHPFVQCRINISKTFFEGIMRNISVKLFLNLAL